MNIKELNNKFQKELNTHCNPLKIDCENCKYDDYDYCYKGFIKDFRKEIEGLKTKEQLREGNCTVLYYSRGTIKETEGSYNSKLDTVFYCINKDDEVIGYIQE